MIESNCRISNSKGLTFYEQDILYDDYQFSGDIQITLNVDYRTPGIGIALIVDGGMSIYDKADAYLFKLGYKETSAYHKLEDVQKRLMRNSVSIVPYKKDFQLIFKKKGKKVTLESEEYGVILQYTLVNSIDKFNIGIYSNAGNVINSIAIASAVPDKWIINMKNTNGGYAKFVSNGFEISDCKDNAEIQQENISMTTGKYYLKYDKENVLGVNDLKAFVFLSSDSRMKDEDKNILKDDGSFTISKPETVILKFTGKNGVLKKIQISDKDNDAYVPTHALASIINGSYIEIETTDVSKVEWRGTIQDIPSEMGTFSIINTDTEGFAPISLGVNIKTEYKYIYNVISNIVEVLINGSWIQHPFEKRSNTVKIFNNMNAVINELTVTDKHGKITNVIIDNTTKKYVPGSITSPIICVDEEGIPLDLSSSYKVVKENTIDMYVFTNYERQLIPASEHIKLSNRISNKSGALFLYGIPHDAIVNMKELYRIKTRGINSLTDFSSKHVEITNEDILSVDKLSGDIYLQNISNYKYIVVDYLKNDSYCINFNNAIKNYEVEIATDRENTSLIYDSYNNDNLSVLNEFKTTNIIPENNCYIVLKRGTI